MKVHMVSLVPNFHTNDWQVREICKNRTVNIGLYYVDIGPTLPKIAIFTAGSRGMAYIYSFNKRKKNT